jgi:hypothetical protein
MALAHIERRLRAMVCANVTLNGSVCSVKSKCMTRLTQALHLSLTTLLLASGCVSGGQTYDDGSDGLGKKNVKPTATQMDAPDAVAPPSEQEGTSETASEATSETGTSETASEATSETAAEGTSETTPESSSNTEVFVDPAPHETSASEEECVALAAAASQAVEAAVAAADHSCETVSDCVDVVAAPSCIAGCNESAVVSAAAVPEIEAKRDELNESVCVELGGANCQVEVGCDPLQRIPACVENTCVYVSDFGEEPDAGPPGDADCFGPERNVEFAYTGMLGCPCQDVGDICVGAAAMICSSNDPDEPGHWEAVEDGPCEPSAGEEGCQGRVVSADMCVALFDTCAQLSTGTFCGNGRRTTLCDDGEIVEDGDCLQDDAFCRPLENGLYCTG